MNVDQRVREHRHVSWWYSSDSGEKLLSPLSFFEGMEMYGLSLFSGIGGLDLALSPWARPVAYCEKDKYAQSVLFSRMAKGDLPLAPIWDDVQTLTGEMLPPIDIIYGGFPCQDISVAGLGAGLAGKRSGLFFEILRLAKEIRPLFLFLENVPAITFRGLNIVAKEISELGYDCRWNIVSAQEVGAPHLRKRWFLLAHSARAGRKGDRQGGRTQKTSEGKGNDFRRMGEELSDAARVQWKTFERNEPQRVLQTLEPAKRCGPFHSSWWKLEPNVGRVAHGISSRVDRLRGLGNSVVPMQARQAFLTLLEPEYTAGLL